MMITNEDYIVYLKNKEIQGVGKWFKMKECLLYKEEDVSSNPQHDAKSCAYPCASISPSTVGAKGREIAWDMVVASQVQRSVTDRHCLEGIR